MHLIVDFNIKNALFKSWNPCATDAIPDNYAEAITQTEGGEKLVTWAKKMVYW